jgi:hypothetical protein
MNRLVSETLYMIATLAIAFAFAYYATDKFLPQ